MKIQEIINQIKSQRPSFKKLQKKGLSDEIIYMIYQSYDFQIENVDNDLTHELLKFCSSFSTPSLEIFGGLTFLKKIKEYDTYYHFGNIELNLLCLEKETGEIIYLDFFDKSLINVIAKSEISFLEILLEIYKIYSSKILGINQDPCKNAELLTQISEEPLSHNFYKSFLGCNK